MREIRRHFGKEIRLSLDNRLDSYRQAEMERHIEKCERCRRELNALHWTKHHCVRHVAVQQGAATPGKGVLPLLNRRALSSRSHCRGNSRGNRTWSLLSGIAVASIVIVLLLHWSRALDFPRDVARDFQMYKGAKLRLELKTPDAKEVESFFAKNGIAFHPEASGPLMVRYPLVGISLHQILGRRGTLCIYQKDANRFLLSEMFPGNAAELPDGALTCGKGPRQLYIYREDNVTMAFWQDGRLICVLASDNDVEELIQMALQKARRA